MADLRGALSIRWFAGFTTLLVLAATPCLGVEGRLVDDVVHSPGLETNLLGDSPDREVIVYLPPGYDDDLTRRYPVLYLLHGYTGNHRLFWSQGYLGNFDLKSLADRMIGDGSLQPMLIVTPNSHNAYKGSMYVNSVVTGAWEDFIVRDVVAHVDASYRTIPDRAARGLGGHSMGGFGAIRLAMRNPDVFVATYGMSPCCLGFVDREGSWVMRGSSWPPTLKKTTRNQFGGLELGGQIQVAVAAAFSPNPEAQPFLADLPFRLEDDEPQLVAEVWQRWVDNTALGMVDAFGANLSKLAGVRFDVGSSDFFPHIPADARAFSAALEARGIAHAFEEYDGNHSDKVPERMETLFLPYFSDLLSDGQETAVESASWAGVKTTVP